MAENINAEEVDRLLDDVSMPTTADELATAAEQRGLSSSTVNFFESLAPDTMFSDRSEVLNATEQLGNTSDMGLGDIEDID